MSRASNDQKGPEYEGGSVGMKALTSHYKVINQDKSMAT